MICHRLYVLLLLLCAVQVSAQHLAENNFDHYTSANGISHNAITEIIQDSTGYIWIATSSGLNRFNGNHFVQFHSNSDSLSLAAEELTGMTWLNKNRFAVYTTGLHIVNARTGETRNLFIPYHLQQYQFKFNMIVRVIGDEEGNIYILSRSGFYHFDQDYRLVSRFDYYSEEEVSREHFHFGRELLQLDKQRLIINSINGLYLYDKRKKKIKKMTANDSPLMAEFVNNPSTDDYLFLQPVSASLLILKLKTDSVVYIHDAKNIKVTSRLPFGPMKKEFSYRTRLVPVNDTLFYLTGHFSGFYKMCFYRETGQVKLSAEKYFRPYLCNALLKDRDNNLWVATNKGLFRQDPAKRQVQLAVLPASLEDSFPNIRIDDIYVRADKLYAGTRAYGGLLLFDKKTLRFDKQVIFKKYSKKGNVIYAITATDSSVLLGTDGPLIMFNETTGKEKLLSPPKWDEGNWTSDLYKDSRGNIWISAYDIYRYHPGTGKFTFIPYHPRLLSVPFFIDEDRDGHIWMAGHGLARFNTLAESFDLLLDSFPFIKMPDKQVNAMAIDGENTIWFNSNNNGLTGYNIHRRSFRHFTRSDGLPDDNMASMIVVNNRLWIACYSGIACMDIQTGKIVSFGKGDGFPDVPILKGARFFYDRTAEQLYLGFFNAIVRFKPDDILQRKLPPHVFIESVAINDQKRYFLPGQNITTSWQDNDIRVTIGSISFSDGHSQGFAYRILKDSLTPWQQLGSQASFSISNLSPGTHRIQVKSFSIRNRWPEQVKEISILVSPPLWLEDWFLLLMAALALLLIYLLVRWQKGLAIKKEMEKTHIEKLKANDYKNQFELEQITNYFSSSLTGKKSEEEVLWDVTGDLIARMNYEDCVIYLWNEGRTKMVQKAAYGPKGNPEIISANVFEVLPGQGIVGHVIQSRQPILLNDTRTDPRYRVDDNFRLSEVCVPIIHNGELLGAIDSEHSLPGYFSERDIKILTTIATLIGNKLKQIESEQSLAAKQKELAGINEQLAEARLSALQAQMNPHFVFNALNSIKRMILDEDNKKASRYLSKFALMIRMTLEHSKEVFVTLQENIEYLKAYLEMEQLRFDDTFTYNIYTNESLDITETVIPSMMIQPLVENAIWHGLMQSEADKKLAITFSQRHNKVICIVEDNGIGISQSKKIKETLRTPHRSLGLENLQKRIKIMNEKYDLDCSLGITDLKDTGANCSGTKVILQFNSINA